MNNGRMKSCAALMLLAALISQPLWAQSNINASSPANALTPAPASWNEVSTSVKTCITAAYSEKNITVDQLVAAGINPNDQRVSSVVNACRQIMAYELKRDFKCQFPNAQGQTVEAICQENFARIVEGKPTPISRDDFIKAYVKGEKVQVSIFQKAKNSEADRIINAVKNFVPKGAKWEKMPADRYPYLIDTNGMLVGPKWREYTTIYYMKDSIKVNDNKIDYDFTIDREIAPCPYSFDQYQVHLGRLYYQGKGADAKLVHWKLEPRGIYVPSPSKRDVDFICSIQKTGNYTISAENMKYINEVRRDHAPILADLRKQQQRELAESANRPRGYYMLCKGSAAPADMNIISVNCTSAAELNSALRWAWGAIRQERPDFAKTCMEAINQMSSLPNADVMRQAAPGFLARCNTGLGFLNGPSRAQASAKKK